MSISITDTGAWDYNNNLHDESIFLDKGLVKYLGNFIRHHKIGRIFDFGCSTGYYLNEIQQIDSNIELIGVEPLVAKSSVKHFDNIIDQDLSKPFDLNKKGSLICLEVLEHIPTELESVAIQNIEKHCDEYLFVSWARPGQGGRGHVNERSLEYVVDIFKKYGFIYLGKESQEIRNHANLWWLKNNLCVFQKSKLLLHNSDEIDNAYLRTTSIDKFQIYDVVFNTDAEIVLIKAGPKLSHQVGILQFPSSSLKIEECPYGHTTIYRFSNVEFRENISLLINGEVIEIKINKYDDFNNKIVFSTEVKDEDDYIKQWIDFHHNLGIDKFIIYDNSDKNTLSVLLKKYIDEEKVVLIKWPFSLFTHENRRTGQTTQQNHSIHAFRSAKYIGFFDVDEYINMKNHNSIPDLLSNLENNQDLSVISGFQMLCKLFFNPEKKSTFGADFFQIFNCKDISVGERQKNFIIPKNLNVFAVHIVTSGNPVVTVDPGIVYFNHYWFLNKKDRGLENVYGFDNSILKHLK